MKAELCINSGRSDLDDIFGDENSISHSINLMISGECVASINHVDLEAMYEILNLEETTQSFGVDSERLNYIMVKYDKNNHFTDFKTILRPIIKHGIKEIMVTKQIT
jgi:hypothetical protein